MNDVHVLPTVADVGRAAAAGAVTHLRHAVDSDGSATWILAGGTSPTPGYRAIVEHHAADLAWQRDVLFLIGDERCVAAESDASNWRRAAVTLLDPLGVPERQRVRPPTESEPAAAATAYSSDMAAATRDPAHPTWDHLWLGIGADGHTLSLFPGAPALSASELVTGVEQAPTTPPARITMTLEALTRVRTALVIVTGRAKARAVAGVLVAGDASLPATRATDAIGAGGGSVTWFIDREAASEL